MQARSIFIVAVILALFGLAGAQNTGLIVGERPYLVTRVIDGDTIVIEGGERVRLLGIDTPERGQKYWDSAKEYLESRVLNKSVVLETDVEDKDKYDRLLRWVIIDSELVNLELVKQGLAKTLFYADVKYKNKLIEAENGARARGVGIWKFSNDPNYFCFSVHWVQSDAPGDDRTNLNGEFVRFRNACEKDLVITGWRVEDERGARFVFPEFVLNAKETVSLYTGSGENNGTALFWNMTRTVWNNDGDTINVWDRAGTQILEYAY